ncbi:MAG: DUF538 domain-containing protein [Bradymonadia bacterium]
MAKHIQHSSTEGERQTGAESAGHTGTQDLDQRNAQTEYLRTLKSPAQQARAALEQFGLPLGGLIPDSVTAFNIGADGRFTLELEKEHRIKNGNVTLVLTPKIEGVMSQGQMTEVSGVYGEKKVMFFSGKGNVLEMKVDGEKLIVQTDHSQAKEIELDVSDFAG